MGWTTPNQEGLSGFMPQVQAQGHGQDEVAAVTNRVGKDAITARVHRQHNLAVASGLHNISGAGTVDMRAGRQSSLPFQSLRMVSYPPSCGHRIVPRRCVLSSWSSVSSQGVGIMQSSCRAEW